MIVKCEVCGKDFPEEALVPLCLYKEDLNVCGECEGKCRIQGYKRHSKRVKI
jgi:hypothetical protein